MAPWNLIVVADFQGLTFDTYLVIHSIESMVQPRPVLYCNGHHVVKAVGMAREQ